MYIVFKCGACIIFVLNSFSNLFCQKQTDCYFHNLNSITESARQSDWDNILACHRGLRLVTSWSYQRSTMGEHKYEHERFLEDAATYNHTTAQVTLDCV